MTNTTYQVRVTSASGLARHIDTTAREADKEARRQSEYSDVIEADILIGGEFQTAYVNGCRVL